jgi:predicted GNAT family acetyltransferase
VPEECRGQGLGAKLAKAALDYAVENKIEVQLSCTYIQRFFLKHMDSEYRQLEVIH